MASAEDAANAANRSESQRIAANRSESQQTAIRWITGWYRAHSPFWVVSLTDPHVPMRICIVSYGKHIKRSESCAANRNKLAGNAKETQQTAIRWITGWYRAHSPFWVVSLTDPHAPMRICIVGYGKHIKRSESQQTQ